MVGDSLLSDTKLAVEELIGLVDSGSSRVPSPPRNLAKSLPRTPGTPLTAGEVFSALPEVRPENAIIAEESTSNYMEFRSWWLARQPGAYFTFASGGLGHGAPCAVGVALAQRKLCSGRPVIGLIGDGAMQYSIQCLSAAATHKLKIIYIVLCNGEYAVLKEFAELEQTPNCPALDLPFLDIPSLARGYGCATERPGTREEIQAAFAKALASDGPTVLAIPIAREHKFLLGAPVAS